MLIGLTGQIGAGKSTAARIFAQLGAVVVDADMIGRQVVEQSPTLLKKLSKRFGRVVLLPSGKLNRRALAEVAFASPKSTRALNSLVHPYLLKELRRQVKRHSKHRKVVIIDAALLLNWWLDREVDRTIVISAPLAIRIKRMSARGLSRAEVIARQKSQPAVATFRSRADFVISNSGTSAELRQRLKKLWQALQKSDC